MNLRGKETVVSLFCIIALAGVACKAAPAEVPCDKNDYESIYTLYDNLDFSEAVICSHGCNTTNILKKAKGIPLANLTEADAKEYCNCLKSIFPTINEEFLKTPSDENVTFLEYDDGIVKSEFMHSTLHINTGIVAQELGMNGSTSYLPEFQTVEAEYYLPDFDEIGEKSIQLVRGSASINRIIRNNDNLLTMIDFPYMDSSIDIRTNRVRIYKIDNRKSVVACYAQAVINNIPVDNESGYDNIDDNNGVTSPQTWRCVTIYVDENTVDVYDIYRGISFDNAIEESEQKMTLDTALSKVSEVLQHDRLYNVLAIEYVYSYIPSEPEYLYFNGEGPFEWYTSYTLCPEWKTIVQDQITGYRYSVLVSGVSDKVDVYRIVELGY